MPTNNPNNAPQLASNPDVQSARVSETRQALTAQQEAMLKSLGQDLDAFAKRLRATETMSQLKVYNAFKDKVLAPLKAHIKDFDKLTIPQVLDQVKGLKPDVVDAFLKNDLGQIAGNISANVAEIMKASGLSESEIQAAIARLSEGGEDMTATVNKLKTVSAALLATPPIMQNIAEKLPGENMLGGPLNFLRKFVGMSNMDVAPREMLTFLTSFRQAELKERNADFTKENFSTYLQENQDGFLGLFKKSKAGVTSFMEFMKDSPGSVREVFGAIGANAPALSSYSANLTELDTNLASLLQVPLNNENKQAVIASITPLASQFGTPMTGDLRQSIAQLRLAVDKTKDAIASMESIAQMPLVEKAGFIQILEQISAQKLTGDAIAAAFFGLQMLVAFQGGLIPNEAGKWAGSSIVDWLKSAAPKMGLSLNGEQIQGLQILFGAIGGMSLVGGVTAAVVNNAHGEVQKPQEKPKKRNFQEELVARVAQKGSVLHEAAMQVSGFNDGSKKVLREALASTDGKMSGYVSEDPTRVAQYRSAILQVRDNLRTSLEAEGTAEPSDQAIKDMAVQEFDGARADAVRTALAGVVLQNFTDQSSLEAKIRERLQDNVMSPVGFESKSGEIAAQILSMKQINAAAAQKKALADYMHRMMTVYNQIQQVGEKPELRLNESDISLEALAKVPEAKEKNTESIEQQNKLQVELLARAALFNLEKKYTDNLEAGQTLIKGKFESQARMLQVFGNAIMNSILRGVLNDPNGNYVKSSGEFSGSKIESWFSTELSSAKTTGQLTLPADFDAKLAEAMKSENLTERITNSLNALISASANGAATDQGLLITTPGSGRFDQGASAGDRLTAGMTQASFEVDRAALDTESAAVEGKLNTLTDTLKSNPAFSMLSVLRSSVISMDSQGAAMQFIAKKIQETMLNNGGPSSFVEAWSLLQKDAGTSALLSEYDTVRNKAYASGIKQPGLEALEGEVSAMYTMMNLSTPELLQVLSQARQGNILNQLGQGGEALWFMSKVAFAIVGWDRVATWAKIPDWKWINPFNFAPNATPAAQAAPSAAAAMTVDGGGLTTFAVLGTSMYSAAAITSVHTHMRLREKNPQTPNTTPDVLPTTVVVPAIKEVEKQTGSKQEGSTWKFNDEKASIDRIDAMLKDSGPEATMLRSTLASKYGIQETGTSQLRVKLMEELQASYSERSAAAHSDLLALSHQAIEMRAKELKLNANERVAWVAQQDQNVRSSVSYLAPKSA